MPIGGAIGAVFGLAQGFQQTPTQRSPREEVQFAYSAYHAMIQAQMKAMADVYDVNLGNKPVVEIDFMEGLLFPSESKVEK